MRTATAHPLQMYLSACPDCGVTFGISEEHSLQLQKSGRRFRCPNGHKMHFDPPEEIHPTREELLKQLDALKQELASAKHRAEQAEARALRTIAECDQKNVTGAEVEPEPEAPRRTKRPAAKRSTVQNIECKHCGKRFAIIGLCVRSHLLNKHGVTLGRGERERAEHLIIHQAAQSVQQ